MELISFDPRKFFLAILVFISACSSMEPSGPVAVEAPGNIETVTTNNDGAFLVEIKNDNSVWYRVVDSNNPSFQKVGEPIKETLGKLIAGYKKQREGLKKTFLIKANKYVGYVVFENVIDALKDNDEFKYNLVTTDEVAENKVSHIDCGNPELTLPPDQESKYSNTETKLTLLLLSNELIFGYEGKNLGAGKVYDNRDLHTVLVKGSRKYGNKFVVIIKPAKCSSYQQTIDILDELTIDKIGKFELIRMSEREDSFIKNLNTKS